MGSDTVKTIVLLMVLVVLSFIVGAQVSDNVKSSIGAFAIIGAIISGAMMIYMGAKVWQLLFLLPPFLEILPISYLTHAIEPCGFAPLAVSAVVLVYWTVLWSLGRARIRWRWAAIFDVPFLLLGGMLVIAYYRYPVALNAMNLDYDAIGGEECVVFLFVVAAYICYSMIPITKTDLERVLRLGFRLFIVASLMAIARGLVMSGSTISMAEESGSHAPARLFLFYPLGSSLFIWAYSKYPVMQMLGSLRCWFITLFAALATVLTSQRQNMAMMGAATIYIACLKREMVVLILSLLAAYAGLGTLSELGVLERMPLNAQRVLTSVPGLKLDRALQKGSTGTVEKRYEIWNYALDARTGAIKDHLWGDGFAYSRAYMQRSQVAVMRGTLGIVDDMAQMTASRNFHNGAIHTISRIGFVGLGVCLVMTIMAWATSIQVLRVWARTETYPYIVLGIIPLPIMLLTYSFANYTTKHFLFVLPNYFFLKLCYCIARESGQLRPLFRSQRYVPMMIQETEKKSVARVEPAV